VQPGEIFRKREKQADDAGKWKTSCNSDKLKPNRLPEIQVLAPTMAEKGRADANDRLEVSLCV
jgi:hypothetical protein